MRHPVSTPVRLDNGVCTNGGKAIILHRRNLNYFQVK